MNSDQRETEGQERDSIVAKVFSQCCSENIVCTVGEVKLKVLFGSCIVILVLSVKLRLSKI